MRARARKLSFTNDFKLASTDRDGLIIDASRPAPDPVKVAEALRKRIGRSLKVRSVSAGGCNGCELKVNALTNVNLDLGRYGIDIETSPQHADGLVLTGPITRNMAEALQLCWDGTPDPQLVIAVGARAISGRPFEASSALEFPRPVQADSLRTPDARPTRSRSCAGCLCAGRLDASDVKAMEFGDDALMRDQIGRAHV